MHMTLKLKHRDNTSLIYTCRLAYPVIGKLCGHHFTPLCETVQLQLTPSCETVQLQLNQKWPLLQWGEHCQHMTPCLRNSTA